MLNYILKEPKHESFYKKYVSKKFLKVGLVGLFPPPRLILSPGQRIRARVCARAMAIRLARFAPRRASRSEKRKSAKRGLGRSPRAGSSKNCERSPESPTLSIYHLSSLVIDASPPRSQSSHTSLHLSQTCVVVTGLSFCFEDVLPRRLG